MKDEIKEILDILKDNIYVLLEDNREYKLLDKGDDKLLLDCITNLQEEKIQLEGKIKQLGHNCKQASDSCRQHRLASKNHIRRLERREQQINIYKSRCEKAIEDIDLVIELIKQQPTEDDNWILNRLNGFKYLLQGEDKDDTNSR